MEPKTEGPNLTTPLNQLEASRVKTIFEQKGIKLKYRILMNFAPSDIVKLIRDSKITAEDIAKAAGR